MPGNIRIPQLVGAYRAAPPTSWGLHLTLRLTPTPQIMVDRVLGDFELNDKYLREAKALMEEGDYVQASEKFWGAAAGMVRAVAAKRDIEIRSHGELHGFASRLGRELNDPELPRFFGTAATLHQNFYENWLPPEAVKDYGEAVKELVERLKRLMG